MIFIVFGSTAGWPPKSRDDHYGKPKTHILTMDFDNFTEIGVPKTSKLFKNHWFFVCFSALGSRQTIERPRRVQLDRRKARSPQRLKP